MRRAWVDDCFRYVKDTNLKANHNLYEYFADVQMIVSDTSKIQI